MIRRLVAGLIVLGLAIGIWALWPREGSDPTPTTTPTAVATTSTVAPTTSTSTLLTTTTTEDTQVVESVEEAEEILRNLIFRRLLAIYHEDETAIADVVASEAAHESAVAAFGNVSFIREPFPEGVVLTNLEILQSDEACLATWTEVDVSAFQGEGASSSAVVILRRNDDEWRWASTWQRREDLWGADCDSQLEPLS